MSEDKEQKKIINLYGALGAALVMAMIPSLFFAVISILFFLGVLIAAYAMRKRSENGSLTENHTTFIIRTIWIAGFFAIATVTAGCVYLLSNVDNTPLAPCADALLANTNAMAQANIAELANLITPCIDNFVHVNIRAFLIAMAISAGPVLLYFLVRFSRGLSRAISGYRVANPKSWF